MTESNHGAAEDKPQPEAPQTPQQTPTAVPSEQPSPWAANAPATPQQEWQPVPGPAHPGFQQQGAGQPDPGQPGALQGASGQPGTSTQGTAAPEPAQVGQPGSPQFGLPGTPPPQTGPFYAQPGVSYPIPPQQQRKAGRGRVVAGVAAAVLAVGALSGGIGGYIGYQAAVDAQPVTNALTAPRPVQQSSNAPAGSIESVAEKVLPSVVKLQLSGGEGSGIVISSDGYVLTNNHVVESAAAGGQIQIVFQDGKTTTATIVGRDPSSDLAVVKAANVTGLPTAELGNSGGLKVGQQVVAVGSPFDLQGTVTSGIVSSLNRPVRAGGEQGSQASVLDAIQTDAAINPGNSGGPLVNMQGQVVGINSAIYSPNSTSQSQGGSVGIGFAIPIDQARRTAKEITDTGKSTQTVLGVSVKDGDKGGAVVNEVTAGGAAEKAGLKAGDVITKFDGRKIDTSDALVAAVRSKAPNDKVQLTVGEDKTVEVTLGSQVVEPK
ncbi:trypsin-like peptidase domain-containing protein [Umezawaea endophytica]|uniref:Trypsin-like peptidase domain-containing protein n=1 Tax=Umezawaea endophytica TaxID=1654476 RepID=A0A9X3AG36_9PSEU|nr:trypsin-like peptidase domain-containing protein [Umezawaea endophytica]MCS7479101.1 trypsin-like peptidase domain-containing protein [Umezawaea endophytica]